MQTDEERNLWVDRWKANKTAFDQGAAHPALAQLVFHARREGGLAEGSKIFSSGCGRAHNEAALARLGYRVDARDLVPQAIDEARAIYGSIETLSLDVADVFALNAPGAYAGVFDRAMLCALQPEDRSKYGKKIADLLQAGGLFMGILFRKVNREQGPPFSFTEKDAWDLFAKDFTLCHAAAIPALYEDSVIAEEWICVWRRRGEAKDEV